MQMRVYSGKVWTNIGSEMQICDGYRNAEQYVCMCMEMYVYIATMLCCTLYKRTAIN